MVPPHPCTISGIEIDAYCKSTLLLPLRRERVAGKVILNALETLKSTECLNELLKRLPCRHPALLIDKITLLEPNKFIAAIKNVTRNEPAFTGAEANSYYPSTLVLESLIQTCSVLATYEQLDSEYDINQNLLSGLTDVVFHNPVLAGDQLLLTVDVKSKKPYIWLFDATAATEEYVVATAAIHLKSAG